MSALSLFLPGAMATVSGHMDALSSQTPNKQRGPSRFIEEDVVSVVGLSY